VTGAAITGNIASGPGALNGGGGVFNLGGTVNLNGVTITGNSTNGAAGSGGGVLNRAGVLTITGSNISDNTSNSNGGGIFNNVGATLNITGTTIAANEAALEGGGIFNAGTATLDGATLASDAVDVWENTGAAAGDLIFAYVDAQLSGASQDTVLDVLANDGSLIESDDNDGPVSTSVVAGAVVAQAGSVHYRVGEFGADASITSYQLYTAVINPIGNTVAESEINDTAILADPVATNQIVTGSAVVGDLDFFSVVVGAANSTIVVIMDDNPDNDVDFTDTDLFIIGPDGTTVIATGDNDGARDGNAAIVRNVAAGTYFVRVGNGGSVIDTDYRFTVLVTTAANQVNETESNDTVLQADTLAAGTFGQGAVSPTGGTTTGNSALRGGGILNTGTITINNSTISGNTANGPAAAQGGGGLANVGGTATLNNTNVEDNAASGTAGSGGGILNLTNGTVTMNGGRLAGNSALRAGGGLEDSAGLLVTLTNVAIENNVTGSLSGVGANPGNGGGVHLTSTGDVRIIGGTVSGNIASREGGGLWNSATGNLTVTGSNLFNNDARGPATDDGGGAVFNNGGTVTLTNNLIIDNLASGTTGRGGGILSLGGTVNISGGFLQRNTAVDAGGGLSAAAGTVNITNNVIIPTNVATGVGAADGNGGAIHL